MENYKKAQQPPDGLSRPTLFAMAIASGLAVANIYYNQPMLGLMTSDLGDPAKTGLVPMATQLGYAAGLFFLLPLGDIVHRRRLIVGQFILLALALLFTGLVQTASGLLLSSLLVGAGATVAQQIVPFAASLARPEKRGGTIGVVMAGILSGILFSRTISGFVGEHAGWREMFLIGSPLALLASALMLWLLPHHAPSSRMGYGTALRSVVHLWRREPALREATMVQALLFGSFSVFWTILAFYLQGPHFQLGADVAGLFGVVGAVGIFAAPLAGKFADRKGPHAAVWGGAVLTLVGWLFFGLWGSLAALVIGVIVLDFGVQSALVSNQHIIYALDGEARSRLNTVFMTGMFLGGSVGSALATYAWGEAGWIGTSILGALMAILAIGVRFLHMRARRSMSELKELA